MLLSGFGDRWKRSKFLRSATKANMCFKKSRILKTREKEGWQSHFWSFEGQNHRIFKTFTPE